MGKKWIVKNSIVSFTEEKREVHKKRYMELNGQSLTIIGGLNWLVGHARVLEGLQLLVVVVELTRSLI